MKGLSFDSRFERLELKYLIDEGSAARLRRAIRPTCRPDAYGGAAGSYPVHSLYLDTPSLAFHRAKERGDPDRIKLRLRRYRGLEAVSLEVKRRHSDVVEKTRVLVLPDALRESARGFPKLADGGPQARSFAERFARHVLASGAEPKLLVRYQREAYTSEVDPYARVTFDRNIEFQRTDAWSLDGERGAWCDLESHLIPGTPRPLVVLELKCSTLVPAWLVDVLRGHDLRRDSVSKYSLGIYLTRRVGGARGAPERARGVLR